MLPMNPFDQDFFVPRSSFAQLVLETPWMRYRPHLDIGSGRGLLAATLALAGLEVSAIDILRRPTQEYPVTICDAATWGYEGRPVVWVARPCHDGWISDAFDRALSMDAMDLIYIGLERNVESDLEDWSHELMWQNVGEKGEHAWRVYCRRDQGQRVVLLRDQHCWGYYRETEYRGTTEARRYNAVGGYMPIPNGSIQALKLAHGLEQMHVPPAAFASAIHHHQDDRRPHGWLDTDGLLWRCGYCEHEALLHEVLAIDNARARRLGFVQLRADLWHRLDQEQPLTARQRIALGKLGYSHRDGVDDADEVWPSDQEQALITRAKRKRGSLITGD